MKIEFEVVFAPIDKETIKNRIELLEWKCTKPNTLMKRAVFENPKNPENSYLRVRDEWWKITCCMKVIDPWEPNINSVKEIETEVQNFDAMKNIFLELGIAQKAYQETYREVWKIWNEIEIMIDEWPGMPPFIEIEWEDEKVVKKYVEKLWLNYGDAIFWTVDQVYKKILWIDWTYINLLPEITFENPPKKIN